jgi:hypothetical protein
MGYRQDSGVSQKSLTGYAPTRLFLPEYIPVPETCHISFPLLWHETCWVRILILDASQLILVSLGLARPTPASASSAPPTSLALALKLE